MSLNLYNLLLQMTKPATDGWAGQNDIDGILRPTVPFVGQVIGKDVFRTLLSVVTQTSQL